MNISMETGDDYDKRSSASLICDSDIFSSVGTGTNSSVSKAIERNLSNAARRLENFLLNIRFISSTFCSQINPWLEGKRPLLHKPDKEHRPHSMLQI